MKRFLFWSGGLAILAGAVARWVWPARLTLARVTAITPGAPPTASVVLRYSFGAMPARVIVDVGDDVGSGGSATIPGDQLFLEVPLVDTPSPDYRVTATATYRLFGRLLTIERTFTTQ